MTSPSNPHATVRLTCEQCRAVDRYAIETLGIPGIVLMENAGRNAADLIQGWLNQRTREPSRPPRIAIFCGRGNNGGDGFVIARHLSRRGAEVEVYLAADPQRLAGDAAVNHAITLNMEIPVRPLTDQTQLREAVERCSGCDAVVDGLLGTGFSGAVREPLAGVIRGINALDGPMVVAVDVPSGLDADRGDAEGEAIRADRTITFLAAKAGYAEPTARSYTGQINVVDIGAPTEWILRKLALNA